MNIQCPCTTYTLGEHPDAPAPCPGVFEISANMDSEGDASVPSGLHQFLNWDIDSSSCEHDYDTMTSAEQQAFVDAISEAWYDYLP